MFKKVYLLILLYLLCFTTLYSQTTDQLILDDTFSTGSQEQVSLIYGYIPYATLFAAITPSIFLPYDTSKYIGPSTLIAGGIPSAMADPQAGLTAMGIAASGFASAFYIESYNDPVLDQYAAWPLLNMAQKTQMWSYYNGYQQARIKSSDSSYALSMKKYNFFDLMAAPWDIDNLRRPSVWVPVLTATAISTAITLFSTNGENAVWSTGNTYIGGKQVPFVVGFLLNFALAILNNTFTAIGEEAVFRGIGYEEFKISYGSTAAKVLDGVLFPAMHVPSEIQAGYSSGQILTSAGYRAALTFGFDMAYDEGGLGASVASHFWTNVCLQTMDYMLSAGVPQ